MAGKVRVDYRLDPELAEWVEAQAVPPRTKTDVVEDALRRARSGQTGASPAAPRPSAAVKDPASLERQAKLNAGRGGRRR